MVLVNWWCTVKYDWETRKLLSNFFKNVKTKLWLLARLKLVSTVACTDSDCKWVNTCSCNKIIYFFRSCIRCVFSVNLYIIFNTCKCTKLTLNNYAVSVCIFNNLLCKSNIFFIWKWRTVNHNRSKSTVNTCFASFKVRTVVKVKGNRKTCFFSCCLYHSNKVTVWCILSCTCWTLKNNRSVKLLCSTGNTLYNFHIIYIESTDSISAFICFFKHFSSSN